MNNRYPQFICSNVYCSSTLIVNMTGLIHRVLKELQVENCFPPKVDGNNNFWRRYLNTSWLQVLTVNVSLIRLSLVLTWRTLIPELGLCNYVIKEKIESNRSLYKKWSKITFSMQTQNWESSQNIAICIRFYNV